MHANDVFSFLKNYFWHQHIKTIQNIQIILNFSKNKFKIFRNAAAAAFSNIAEEEEEEEEEETMVSRSNYGGES
jgi:hypothetical protein